MPAKKVASKKAVAKRAAAKKTTKKAPAKRGPKPGRAMSDEHKAALSTGRQAGQAVRAYLDALESHKPKRGRKRTPESIGARLSKIEADLPTADAITRLAMVQEQLNLTAELSTLERAQDLSAIEKDFVAHAKAYSEAKGISYTAWRTVGVSAEVLKAAGISRAS